MIRILRQSGRGLAFLVAALFSFGQTLPNAVPFKSAEVQFVDSNGVPLAGGKVYTCIASSSCPGNPQATYTDSTAAVQNQNPVILDSSGRAQIWIGSSAYKFVLQDALGVLQWTEDNVSDTTLYFVNYVKTAGTATLISYNPPSGQAQTTVDAELTALTSNPYVNLKLNCGAKGDGSTNDATAIATCLSNNNIVFAPPGTYCVGSTIVVPQKTQLIGAGRGDSGGPNTVFKACSGFPSFSPVIKLCGDSGPCFGVQVENLTIDCNSKTGCIGGYNAFAEEQSWFKRVLVENAPAIGISIDGYSQSPNFQPQNSGPYEDLEISPGAAATANTLCMKVTGAVILRRISGITCNAVGYSVQPTNAITVDFTVGSITNSHIEHFANGILLGSSSNGLDGFIVQGLQIGPDITTGVTINGPSGTTTQNIFITGVVTSVSSGNLLIDNCNSYTINAGAALVNGGLGTYMTGQGACGSQTVFSTRVDQSPKFMGSAMTILKNLSLPGTGNNDSGVIMGLSNASKLGYHDFPVVAGTNGPYFQTGATVQGHPCLIVQTSDVSQGSPGGGLCLNGNGFSGDASQGGAGAGYSGDLGTFIARGTTASGTLYLDGIINFFSNSGLSIGNPFTPTTHIRIGGSNILSVDGTAGFSGTKIAGACTFTILYGIITNVTGC